MAAGGIEKQRAKLAARYQVQARPSEPSLVDPRTFGDDGGRGESKVNDDYCREDSPP
jgi:hypothetical protein